MTPERFQVTGKRVDNGETVTGYLYRGAGMRNGEEIEIFCIGMDFYEHHEIDPDSAEPVAVKVLDAHWVQLGDKECPCCHRLFWHQSLANYKPEFCDICGQRLDWEVQP